MKNQLRSFAINFSIILGFTTTAWAYIVKKGDTLSEIAYKHISPKVYGKTGSVNKILALNPTIKNPHFLSLDQIVNLGEFELSNSPKIKTNRYVAEESQIIPSPSRIASESSPLFKRGSVLALTPFYSILNITSKDNTRGSESTIASKYYIGANASYVQEWTKDFQTAVNLKLGSINFEKPTTSTKTLQDSGKFISSLGLESNQSFNNNFHLKLNLDYGKELFIRAASTQNIAVDAINIPSVGAKVSYDIKELDPFVLGIAGSYEAKMPAQTDYYDVKLGHKLGASVYLTQHTGSASDSKFQVELGVAQRRQDTSVASQTETSVNLGVKFFYGVGSRP